ncbi:Serine/threonine-protein kinase ULK3 [Papilio machaon]|uniref:non-specific serine/threonine protein kinase n=1 Tax=Papilio machaon TaxID=76193 RepID=A0A0N1IPF4_PAPMA|nr:Serine/threonine-protein kinase ULK3 [Papilio machaon]
MAPEMLRGRYDARVDLWSVGEILLRYRFAQHMTEEQLRCLRGSPLYMAPEMLRGRYDARVDLWSVGEILLRYRFAQHMTEEQLRCLRGSPLYMAPEMLRGRYDARVDLWSVGEILLRYRFAQHMTEEQLRCLRGSPLYMAPEMLRGRYDARVDLWSVGEILLRYRFAQHMTEEQLRCLRGSPLYMAPEMLRGRYDARVDLWSVGEILLRYRFAQHMTEEQLRCLRGSPLYMAPEMLRGRYDARVDLWSVGEILLRYRFAQHMTEEQLRCLRGSPLYMAPEMLRGRYDARVDLWSVGEILLRYRFAQHMTEEQLRCLRGSPLYMAPEMLRGRYDARVDLWSVGEILLRYRFAQHMTEEQLRCLRGSPLYMAPEMLRGRYDARVDLWSVGVIMYECLFGRAPYSSATFKELVDKIQRQAPIELPPRSSISPGCQDLLSRLLQHDPDKRISYEEFFAHEYLDLEHMPSKENYEKVSVIMYECLFGRAPYSSATFKELVDKIQRQAPIELPPRSSISPGCQDLLSRLLQHDPDKRISYEEFFAHEYLDLEHMPSKENYEKAVGLIKRAIELDSAGELAGALSAYSDSLLYLVPAVAAESDALRRSALTAKLTSDSLLYLVPAVAAESDALRRSALTAKLTSWRARSPPTATVCSIWCPPSPQRVTRSAAARSPQNSPGQLAGAPSAYSDSLLYLVPAVAAESDALRRSALTAKLTRYMERAEEIKRYLKGESNRQVQCTPEQQRYVSGQVEVAPNVQDTTSCVQETIKEQETEEQNKNEACPERAKRPGALARLLRRSQVPQLLRGDASVTDEQIDKPQKNEDGNDGCKIS